MEWFGLPDESLLKKSWHFLKFFDGEGKPIQIPTKNGEIR